MSEDNTTENEGRTITPLASDAVNKLAPKPLKEFFTGKGSTRPRAQTEDSEDWEHLK